MEGKIELIKPQCPCPLPSTHRCSDAGTKTPETEPLFPGKAKLKKLNLSVGV